MIKSLKKIKFIYVLLFIFLLLAFYFNSTTLGEQQFTYLAQSFLHGKTYLLTMPGSWADATYFKGHYYWPQGFFPAVLLVPFVFIADKFGLFFYQGFVSLFLGLSIIYFIVKISKKLDYSKEDSFYWAFAFVFATAFIGLYLMPFSWYYAQVVTVFLMFGLIYEYLHKKRYWLLFLISVALLLTRVTAGFGAFLFLFLDIVFIKDKKYTLFRNLSFLFISAIIGSVILLKYNFVRFGDYFNSGYADNILSGQLLKARHYGIFNLIHIPGNLYYAFLAAPLPVQRDEISMVLKFPYLRPSSWGMSIFITSPYLIYLIYLKYKDKLSKALIASVLLTLVLIFAYFSIGFRQFGYRYFFDIAPFVFLLLMKNYKDKNAQMSLGLRSIIILSSFVNMFLFLVFYYRL